MLRHQIFTLLYNVEIIYKTAFFPVPIFCICQCISRSKSRFTKYPVIHFDNCVILKGETTQKANAKQTRGEGFQTKLCRCKNVVDLAPFFAVRTKVSMERTLRMSWSGIMEAACMYPRVSSRAHAKLILHGSLLTINAVK